MRTTQRCNNRAYSARISRHSPERRKGVTPARITRVLRAVFATSFLSGVCCVTARRTRVFSAVFATPFVWRREYHVGVCSRVFRAYFATCPPDAANATRRLGEGGCDAAANRAGAGGRECHARVMARVGVGQDPGRFAAGTGGGRGGRIGCCERLLRSCAVPCRRPRGRPVCVSGGGRRSRWRRLGSMVSSTPPGAAGFEPDAVWCLRRPSASPVRHSRAPDRRCVPLCGGLAAALRAVPGREDGSGTPSRLPSWTRQR